MSVCCEMLTQSRTTETTRNTNNRGRSPVRGNIDDGEPEKSAQAEGRSQNRATERKFSSFKLTFLSTERKKFRSAQEFADRRLRFFVLTSSLALY